MSKKAYSIAEVASLLGVSRIAVFNKVKKGHLRAQKVGRKYVIQPSALSSLGVGPLTPRQKKVVTQGVKKVVEQYGETLQLLAKE